MEDLSQTFENKAKQIINDDDQVIALTSRMPGGISIEDIKTQAMGYIVGREFMQQNEQIKLRTEDDRVLMVMKRYDNAKDVAQDMDSQQIESKYIQRWADHNKDDHNPSLFDHLYAGEVPETSPELGAPV